MQVYKLDRTLYEMQQVLQETFEYIPAIKQPLVVWRGISRKFDESKYGFLSTTLSSELARRKFHEQGGMLLKIHLMPGTKIIPIFAFVFAPAELEIILPLDGNLMKNYERNGVVDATFFPKSQILGKRKREIEWEIIANRDEDLRRIHISLADALEQYARDEGKFDFEKDEESENDASEDTEDTEDTKDTEDTTEDTEQDQIDIRASRSLPVRSKNEPGIPLDDGISAIPEIEKNITISDMLKAVDGDRKLLDKIIDLWILIVSKKSQMNIKNFEKERQALTTGKPRLLNRFTERYNWAINKPLKPVSPAHPPKALLTSKLYTNYIIPFRRMIWRLTFT